MGVAKNETVVDIEGRRVQLSNLDKVLYPATGFTKGQIIDYYVRIAPMLLPHLEGRPLTLKRYPNGVAGMHFYEKNCPSHRPSWVQTARIWSAGNNKWMDYCTVQDLATLVWCANLACIELHTSLSRGDDPLRPTMMVFDLDPGAPAGIVECCQVALRIREVLSSLGVESFPKTSGSKGLQIYAPVNTPAGYDETKPFAHELARMLERRQPELVVSEMKKILRAGQGLRRLEPERRSQDDHLRLLSARQRQANGLDASRVAGSGTLFAQRRSRAAGIHLRAGIGAGRKARGPVQSRVEAETEVAAAGATAGARSGL